MKKITLFLTMLFLVGTTYAQTTLGTPQKSAIETTQQKSLVKQNVVQNSESILGDDNEYHVSTSSIDTRNMATTLTTLYAGGNSGSNGGAVYFDITVGASDIDITSIDLNTAEAGAFTIDVYAFVGTYVGNQDNPGMWGAVAATGAGTAAPVGTPSTATLGAALTLVAGTQYAIAIVFDATHSHTYTNGDGTNQQYFNADLTIDLGSGSNVPFTAPIFDPRVFNGGITYDLAGGGGGCAIVSDCNLDDATPDDAASPFVWDRPFAGGTCCSGLGPVSYDVYGPFTVDAAGAYDILSVQVGGWDGYLFIYENCFDPLDQLTGFVAGDDDGGGGIGTSDIIAAPLVTGTDYYIVTTGFSAGDFGDYTTVINGPGAVTCGGGGGGGCGGTLPNYTNVTNTGDGTPSQDFVAPANDIFDSEAADDFVVPGVGPATICEVAFTGIGTGIPTDPNSLITLNIYDDGGGVPGALLYTETFSGPASDPGGTGSFVLTPTAPPSLTGGTLYYMSAVVTLEFAVGGQWFWSTATDGNDGPYQWQNPGGGFATPCATWGDGGAVCGVGSGTGPDLLMDISFIELLDNDECTSATPIACDETITGDTSNNTDQGGFNGAPDEWFSFTGSGSPQVITASLCDGGTTYDSRLTVYDACGAVELLTNDDSCGVQSELSFLSDGTTTYFIAVEGFNAASSGPFSLAITCVDPLANDNCDGAIALACGVPVLGTTLNATDDTAAAPDCDTPTSAPGVWYVYEDTTGLVTDILISTCSASTDYDTKISVYTGDCAALPLTCVAGNDDSCGVQSEVEFQSDGNTTYYILVHGFGGQTGNFELTMTCTPVPPPNDMIANSIDVDEIGFPYTDPAVAMPAATTEAGNPAGCAIDGANGVWYNFVSQGNGTANAQIVSPAGASFIVFYKAPNEMATETDLEYFFQIDNQCAPGTSASITTEAGQAYYLFVVNTGGITDITIDGTLLGTDENIIEGFNYYPNPANDILNLTSVDTIETVEIYNLLGQQVLGQDINATNSQLNISALATGAYLMKVSVNGKIGTYKIIKR